MRSFFKLPESIFGDKKPVRPRLIGAWLKKAGIDANLWTPEAIAKKLEAENAELAREYARLRREEEQELERWRTG